MNKKEKLIIAVNSVLTKAVYIIYPVLLIYLAAAYITEKETGIVPAVIVPGISFVAVSIFRRLYNAPRPYEMPGATPPVIKKDSPGKSFPSRHIFSVFIIAVTVFQVWPVPGILTGVAGALLAYVRVAGGVHFPKDVIAGAVIGIACGVIGYYGVFS